MNGVRFSKRNLRRWQRRLPRPQGASKVWTERGRKPGPDRARDLSVDSTGRREIQENRG